MFSVEFNCKEFTFASQFNIVNSRSIVDIHGLVFLMKSNSSPSLIPPPSESETFQKVQVRFSSQFCNPSPSISPSSSILVGSVSPSSTIPFPLISSSPSSR